MRELTKGHIISVLDHGYVRYVDHLGDDQRIVESARISYNSKSKGPEKDKKLLAYLYKNLHMSPFEQCSVTFNIKLPVFVMRQLVRHRTAKLNEISARYTQLPSEFYIPETWRKQDTKNKQGSLTDETWNPEIEALGFLASGQKDCTELFKDQCDEIYKVYESMIKSGVAREMARMILPVNIYTEIYWTVDLRNLLHFITLREDSHAQWEIQQYGIAIKEILVNLFPNTMEAYERYKWKLVDLHKLINGVNF